MNDALADKLKHLPTSPGVYQHKDAVGTVLYVGKAKNLRNRVRSYFQEGRPREGRIRVLVSKIEDVELIVTDTEAEALILENNLIKELKPRYNVLLKDDKSYPFICVKKERFPRVFPTRKVRRDGSLYFGPYTDVKAMNLALKTIKDLFKSAKGKAFAKTMGRLYTPETSDMTKVYGNFSVIEEHNVQLIKKFEN